MTTDTDVHMGLKKHSMLLESVCRIKIDNSHVQDEAACYLK